MNRRLMMLSLLALVGCKGKVRSADIPAEDNTLNILMIAIDKDGHITRTRCAFAPDMALWHTSEWLNPMQGGESAAFIQQDKMWVPVRDAMGNKESTVQLSFETSSPVFVSDKMKKAVGIVSDYSVTPSRYGDRK